MHRTLCTFASTILYTAGLSAQAGPGQYAPPAGDSFFNNVELAKITQPNAIWNGNAGTFQQISATKSGFENLKPGEYAVALTSTNIHQYYTGRTATQQSVMLARVDTTTSPITFTPTDVAKNMNATTGNIFGLMVEPRDGLFACVDWPTGPMISYRARRVNPTTKADEPFDVPIPIPGIGGPYVDPCPCYIDGQLHILFVSSSIEAVPINPTITNGKLTAVSVGAKTIIASVTGGVATHSPTPVIDKDGNAQGLFHAVLFAGSDSDMYFKGSLDPNDTSTLIADAAGWQNNGAAMGGKFLWANVQASTAYMSVEAAYMVGSSTKVGGNATITLYAQTDRKLPIYQATVAAGLNTSQAVPIPGWKGEYALGSTVLVFAGSTSTTADDRADITIPVPNNPSVSGLKAPIQALVSLTTGGQPILTNTAQVSVK